MSQEITVKVTKTVKEAGKSKFINPVHSGYRAAKITSYQAIATHIESGLTSQSGICDSRKKAIESATKNLTSFVNSAKAQGLI